MKKVILSLDGGGIRGAATTQFLFHIENALKDKYGKSIRDCIDFYAGTSTGSIIVVALATTDLSMEEINNLYSYANAQQIFKENKGWFEIDGINAPKYEASGKTHLLREKFSNSKIGDVPQGKDVLAVTYEITTRKPIVIKSTKDLHRDILSSDVTDASSAAPTYFPTKEVDFDEQDCWLVDGGVIANNPTMCAIAEARKEWDISMEDILVLSVGIGYRTRKINGPESQKWGAIGWFTHGHILDLLSDEKVVGYQAKTILQAGNYIRVNADLRTQPGFNNPPDDAMDDVHAKNIDKLKAMGDWWFKCYGDDVINFLAQEYHGLSLDGINPKTGNPVKI